MFTEFLLMGLVIQVPREFELNQDFISCFGSDGGLIDFGGSQSDEQQRSPHFYFFSNI